MKNEQITEKEMLELAQSLPNEKAPERDLWPGIERAISSKPQELATDRSWMMKVAAAFLPVALVGGLFWGQQTGPSEDAPWLQPIVASFEMQKQHALRQVSEQRVVNDNWQMSLDELEQAEASLKKALQQQPEDTGLMKMLSQVYQQQINLIQKAHRPSLQQI